MLQRPPAAALLASFVVWSASAGAQPPAAAQPVAKPEVRRDPRGLKGVSPFREALKRGESALLAHDLEGALAAFREAISREPENALGHYRVGEVQVLKGDLSEAEAAFSAGLRFVTPADLGLKAKLEFVLADLRERQRAYDEAVVEWTAYEAFTTAQTGAQGFPASGTERKRVILAWKKVSADSLEVKARIEKGLKAAEDAVKKSSK